MRRRGGDASNATACNDTADARHVMASGRIHDRDRVATSRSLSSKIAWTFLAAAMIMCAAPILLDMVLPSTASNRKGAVQAPSTVNVVRKHSQRRQASVVKQYKTYKSVVILQRLENDKSKAHEPFVTATETDTNSTNHHTPNFGGLDIMNRQNKHMAFPSVPSDADEQYTAYMDALFAEYDKNYENIGQKDTPNYERDNDEEQECYRASWRDNLDLNCNTIHEQTLERPYDGSSQPYNIEFRGNGHYRDTWVLEPGWPRSIYEMSGSDADIVDHAFVYKRFRMRHEITRRYLGQMQKEALIMDSLTSSPRIVDIYGHCGLTIFAEHMLEEVATPMMSQFQYDEKVNVDKVKKEQENGVFAYNNLTNTERLEMALVMAESTADIHGFIGGVIAHGDLHPVQWLKNAKGQIKLNDYNNAEILEYNPRKEQYCPVQHCYGGIYRSPEELGCRDCDEQMDTFSFGNNVYILVTGLWPFWEHSDSRAYKRSKQKIADPKVMAKPYIDPRFYNRSYIEDELIKVMYMAWEFDAAKRSSIFDIVKKLREIKGNVTTSMSGA